VLVVPHWRVDVPALGTGFAGVRFRYFHDNPVFLSGWKLQELLEAIV